jgi:hypothetical protein
MNCLSATFEQLTHQPATAASDKLEAGGRAQLQGGMPDGYTTSFRAACMQRQPVAVSTSGGGAQ